MYNNSMSEILDNTFTEERAQSDSIEALSFWETSGNHLSEEQKEINEKRNESLSNFFDSLTCLDEENLQGILVAENAGLKIDYTYNKNEKTIGFKVTSPVNNLGEFDNKTVVQTNLIIESGDEPNMIVEFKDKDGNYPLKVGVGFKDKKPTLITKLENEEKIQKTPETISKSENPHKLFNNIQKNQLRNVLKIIGESKDGKFELNPGYKITKFNGKINHNSKAEKNLQKRAEKMGLANLTENNEQNKAESENLSKKQLLESIKEAADSQSRNRDGELPEKIKENLAIFENILSDDLDKLLEENKPLANTLSEIKNKNGDVGKTHFEWLVGNLQKGELPRAEFSISAANLIENGNKTPSIVNEENLPEFLLNTGICDDYETIKERLSLNESNGKADGELLDSIMELKLLSKSLEA